MQLIDTQHTVQAATLAKLIELRKLWHEDVYAAKAGFVELITSLEARGQFYLASKARRELARLLEDNRLHIEAADQYALALNLLLQHPLDEGCDGAQLGEARVTIWRIFAAQLNAGHTEHAAVTASLALNGYYRARLHGGNMEPVVVQAGKHVEVMEAALEAEDGTRSWESVLTLKCFH